MLVHQKTAKNKITRKSSRPSLSNLMTLCHNLFVTIYLSIVIIRVILMFPVFPSSLQSCPVIKHANDFHKNLKSLDPQYWYQTIAVFLSLTLLL
jgi:hypothetical protein